MIPAPSGGGLSHMSGGRWGARDASRGQLDPRDPSCDDEVDDRAEVHVDPEEALRESTRRCLKLVEGARGCREVGDATTGSGAGDRRGARPGEVEGGARRGAPRANALCERFLGSVRRECLDHMLIMSETHLRRLAASYVSYFTDARPHQGIEQRVPRRTQVVATASEIGEVIVVPVLGGLHHDYRRAA